MKINNHIFPDWLHNTRSASPKDHLEICSKFIKYFLLTPASIIPIILLVTLATIGEQVQSIVKAQHSFALNNLRSEYEVDITPPIQNSLEKNQNINVQHNYLLELHTLIRLTCIIVMLTSCLNFIIPANAIYYFLPTNFMFIIAALSIICFSLETIGSHIHEWYISTQFIEIYNLQNNLIKHKAKIFTDALRNKLSKLGHSTTEQETENKDQPHNIKYDFIYQIITFSKMATLITICAVIFNLIHPVLTLFIIPYAYYALIAAGSISLGITIFVEKTSMIQKTLCFAIPYLAASCYLIAQNPELFIFSSQVIIMMIAVAIGITCSTVIFNIINFLKNKVIDKFFNEYSEKISLKIPQLLRYMPKKTQIRMVTNNLLALRYTSLEIRDDYDTVIHAVRHNGLELKFASKDLRCRKEIILAAIKQNPTAMEFISRWYDIRNENAILQEIKKNGMLLKHVSPRADNYKEIILAAVKQNGMALEFVDYYHKEKNQAIVIAAVRQNIRASQYVSRHNIFQTIKRTAVNNIRLNPQILNKATRNFFQNITNATITPIQALFRESILANIFFQQRSLYLQLIPVLKLTTVAVKVKGTFVNMILAPDCVDHILKFLLPMHDCDSVSIMNPRSSTTTSSSLAKNKSSNTIITTAQRKHTKLCLKPV